jgi:hypothetical protein
MSRWLSMMPNGPAIKCENVTRRRIRAGSPYFSHETVTVQGGYGAVFAIMAQILGALRVSRYNFNKLLQLTYM